MRNVIKQLRLGDMLEQKDLKRRLIQGGMRTSSAPVTFTFVRLALPIGLAMLAFFYSLSLFPGLVAPSKNCWPGSPVPSSVGCCRRYTSPTPFRNARRS